MVESIADIEEFYYLEDIDYPSEPLNFYNLYGEYDYQKSNSQWVKVNQSNSSLTMNFPVLLILKQTMVAYIYLTLKKKRFRLRTHFYTFKIKLRTFS